eukprot:scaffold158782_cov14-Tisochrysis_lutea.AAC.1
MCTSSRARCDGMFNAGFQILINSLGNAAAYVPSSGKPLNNLSSYTSRLQCCVPVYFLASPTPIAAPLTECAFGRLAVSSSSFVLLSLVYSCQQQELIRSHFLPICASLFCRLHLPEPNPFVPTDLSLKTEEASAFVASGIVGPQLIEEQPG